MKRSFCFVLALLLASCAGGSNPEPPGVPRIGSSTTARSGHVQSEGTQYAYVPSWSESQQNQYSTSITFIDLATRTDQGTTTLSGDQILGIALSPDGTRLYAALNIDDYAVAVFDTASRELLTKYVIGQYTSGYALCVAVSPDGKTLYAGTSQGIFALDASSGSILHQWQQNSIYTDLRIGPKGDYLYAISQDYGLQKVSTATGQVTGTNADVGWGIALSSDGAFLYGSGGNGTNYLAMRISTASMKTLATAILPHPAGALALSPDGERLAVATSQYSGLFFVATKTMKVLAQGKTGPESANLEYDAAGNLWLFYTTDPSGGLAEIVRGSRTVTQVVPTPPRPSGMGLFIH